MDIKWPKLIDRAPVILIENGQIHKKNMLDSHVTIDNLLGRLTISLFSG
ncbi:MAG: YetF domain-containing protein [Desulfotomaculaceae bacterium]